MLTKWEKEKFKRKCEEGITVFYDYHDVANSHFISCISEHHNEVNETWMEAFKDELYDWCNPNESVESIRNDIMWICSEIGINYKDLTDEEVEELYDLAQSHLIYGPDYDHYLKQEICVDIFVDTGDYNFDLGCNEIYPHYNGKKGEPIDDECCMVWLANTQGYDKKCFKEAMDNTQEMNNSKFLESCFDELENCTSHMNSLVFLKKMTLKEYLELLDSKAPVHIEKETRCGLFDKWNGAGGLLDISLEKDIDIPREMIHKITEDGQFRYNIREVYGVTDSFWEE